MVQLASEEGAPRFTLVEEEAERHCNAAFSYNSAHGGVVVTTWEFILGFSPTELFVNYSIKSY